MSVFLFPGQGSQKVGMGGDLFDEVLHSIAIESEIDSILGYSIRQLCLQDAEGRLKQTNYTQPALYVVNALHCQKAVAEGGKPTAVAGHSLGEFNALLAAGCFDFLTGLRLVAKRGELMSKALNGGMLAVVGLSADRMAQVVSDAELYTLDAANFNAPTQTVLSGPIEDLKLAAPLLQAAGAAMCVQLPVSAAFHSRYMRDAARAFGDFLAGFEFQPPALTVLSNVTALPYRPDATSAEIREKLVQQMVKPVRWMEIIRYFAHQGEEDLREVGPGNVLTRLTQQIRAG